MGEYLKELELTEGRSTGIPTIQNVLKTNGSPRAIVVTDEERTFFRITIPCHEDAGNIIADIASRDGLDPKDDPKGGPKELSERQILILNLIKANDLITIQQNSTLFVPRICKKMAYYKRKEAIAAQASASAKA